jgi:ATP-dependent protease ClpP protease subunit
MSKATFNILGDIVANDAERWYESDVMPAMVIGWLNKQAGDIEININSNGGDVAGGLAIANAIKAYKKGKKTCNVLGVAASMASVIACAGDELTMGQGAFLMVHNPWTVTMGNAEELRKDADVLDKMRDSILSFYQSKAYGKSADDLKALMDAETWLTADDARAAGFLVDDYAGEFKAAASLTRRAFAKAPDAAKAFVEFHDRKPEPPKPPAQPEASGSQPTPPAQPETVERPSERSEAEGAKDASSANWEARFKGLSQKFNDLQKKSVEMLAAAEEQHKAALAARDAENAALKTQLEQGAKDLADANAKVSELSAKLEENAKALQKATDDLAQTRDSLKASEDKVQHLEATRDALTAGVLTPPSEAGYAAKMKAAKTPEEREALRAAKRAGKIK